MSKLTKEEAATFIEEADTHTRLAEYSVQQLPRTPGRDTVQKGLDDVKRGLDRVRREAEVK